MRYRLIGLSILLLLSSCGKFLDRSMMLRIGPNYPYSQFSETSDTQYRIAPDDRVNAMIYTNDGSGMINMGGNVNVGSSSNLSIKIESDGFAKLPIFGRIYLEGLTIRQAEMLIEDKFSTFYNNPFVLLEVSNRRVMLFAGTSTQVVNLTNDNTTLFEVLANSGGIPANGKADKVKIIRGDLKNPQVYVIDLSTLAGVQNADLVMQANDIIYIETRKGYIGKVLSELGPYISVLTTVITTAAIITSLRNL